MTDLLKDSIVISIAKDFSSTPGARYRTDGKFSGEQFREEKLEPIFNSEDRRPITVILDGTEGYATSFLEEAFGGLARKYGIDTVQKRLSFISDEERQLIDEIHGYVVNAETKKK